MKNLELILWLESDHVAWSNTYRGDWERVGGGRGRGREGELVTTALSLFVKLLGWCSIMVSLPPAVVFSPLLILRTTADIERLLWSSSIPWLSMEDYGGVGGCVWCTVYCVLCTEHQYWSVPPIRDLITNSGQCHTISAIAQTTSSARSEIYLIISLLIAMIKPTKCSHKLQAQVSCSSALEIEVCPVNCWDGQQVQQLKFLI